MNNLTSLFLSQSYKDTWDDYNRSLTSETFPQWDYIILTASDENQAAGKTCPGGYRPGAFD